LRTQKGKQENNKNKMSAFFPLGGREKKNKKKKKKQNKQTNKQNSKFKSNEPSGLTKLTLYFLAMINRNWLVVTGKNINIFDDLTVFYGSVSL
jgi:hypothetical protein